MKIAKLLACATLALCGACKDDPVTPGGGSTAGNVMTATVDGLAVNPTTVTAQKGAGRIFITGTGAFRSVTLSLQTPTSPGEVHLFINDGANVALIGEGAPPNNPVWSTAFVPLDTAAGPQYSIVAFTTVNDTLVAGAFFLKAGPAAGGAIGLRYGQGTFKVKF